MRWLAKAMLQDVLSHTPGGERLNYVLQRRILHTLPLSAEGFRGKASRALEHFAAFRQFVGVEPAESFYEFGASWDLTVPLTYYALGDERQTLVDVRPLAPLELVERRPHLAPAESAAALPESFAVSRLSSAAARVRLRAPR
jgi:hypothetical protein